MENIRTLYVGFDGEKVVDTQETLKQVQEVEKLECVIEADGQLLSWKVFDNPDKPRSIFQFILGDRKRRVDEHTAMADRPPIAVVTAVGNKAVRLEFYEGHDSLECSFDLRSKELKDKKLPCWMESDPEAYDPVKFLKEALGLPEELTKPLMEAIHQEKKDG